MYAEWRRPTRNQTPSGSSVREILADPLLLHPDGDRLLARVHAPGLRAEAGEVIVRRAAEAPRELSSHGRDRAAVRNGGRREYRCGVVRGVRRSLQHGVCRGVLRGVRRGVVRGAGRGVDGGKYGRRDRAIRRVGAWQNGRDERRAVLPLRECQRRDDGAVRREEVDRGA